MNRSGAAIGIDLGGTKIEGVRLSPDGSISAQRRVPSPHGDYAATIAAVQDLVAWLDAITPPLDALLPVGLGIPGSVSKRTGRVHNANSTWLNGRDFTADLSSALARPVRIANDANCFALSESVDGAGAGFDCVFGVILGTGVGGGVVVKGGLLDGPLGISGEWGHTALPCPAADEWPGPQCWCGRNGCMEVWVSGPALAADHAHATGFDIKSPEIAQLANRGDAAAMSTLARHADRLARGLAQVVNIIDPDIIVLGGGLSQLGHLYAALPTLMAPHIFADAPAIRIAPPKWGDASGVRGAAWLVASAT